MRYMKEILKKNRNWVLVYLALGLASAFLANYKADYFQKIVDGLTDRTITFHGILLYGLVLIVSYGMNYLDNYPDAKLGNEIYLDFKLLALRKIGRMDYSEYQRLGTGKLIQQIENGADAGKGVLYGFWFSVVRDLVPTILFSLYFIWKIDRNITCFLMAGYLIVFLVTNLLLKGLYQIKENILTNEEELNHFLVRGFMEMPLFRMKRQFPGEIGKASKAKRIIVASKIKMTMIHEAFFTIFAVLVACLDVGILAYAWKNSQPLVRWGRGGADHADRQCVYAYRHIQRHLCAVQTEQNGMAALRGAVGSEGGRTASGGHLVPGAFQGDSCGGSVLFL